MVYKRFGWDDEVADQFNGLELNRPFKRGVEVHPMDNLNVATAMTAAGTYDWKRDGRPPPVPEKLFMAVERFQADQGLKVDGVMNPGGPTQTRLNEVLPARMERPFIRSPRYAPLSQAPAQGKQGPAPREHEVGLHPSEKYDGLEFTSMKAAPASIVWPKSMAMENPNAAYPSIFPGMTSLSLLQNTAAKDTSPQRLTLSLGSEPTGEFDDLSGEPRPVSGLLNNRAQIAQARQHPGQRPSGPTQHPPLPGSPQYEQRRILSRAYLDQAGPPTLDPVDPAEFYRRIRFDPSGSNIGIISAAHPTLVGLAWIAAQQVLDELAREQDRFKRMGLTTLDVDAIRHALWNYRLVRAGFEPEHVRMFMDAYERHAPPGFADRALWHGDRMMDLYNNHVGRGLAIDPSNYGRRDLYVVIEALQNGHLQRERFRIR